MWRTPTIVLLALALIGVRLPGQSPAPPQAPVGHQHAAGTTHRLPDSSFTALKARGKRAMRVDQDTAQHLFDALPDGGRIELQNTTGDSVAIAGIREHFKEIESAFRRGEFAIPMFVHDGEVPGTAVMAARKDRIIYIRRDLPRGAELRLRSKDAETVRAIHAFMAFQRREHRAGGNRG